MARTCAILQPHYLPWLGYFEMIDRVDVFVFLDGNGIVQDIVVGKKKPAPEMQFWPFGD